MFEYVTIYGKLTTNEELKLDNVVTIGMWHDISKFNVSFRVHTILKKDGITYVDLDETEIIKGIME